MRSRTQRRPCVRSRAGDEPLKLVETPLGARSSDTPPGGPFLPSDKPRGSRLPCRQALHPSVASLRNQSPDHEHICGSLLHGGTATPPESSLRSETLVANHTARFPSPVRRHIPLLTELEFISIADATKRSPRLGWHVLDCGGKRSATPLSHAQGGLIVQPPSPAQKRRRRYRSAGALHDAAASSELSIDCVATKIPRLTC